MGADGGVSEVAEDRFLAGRLSLRQFATGHRAGTDAILLAAAVGPATGALVDLGSGVGTAGLAAAVLAPGLAIALAEIDPERAELAAQNIALNGLAGRAAVLVCDALSAASRRAGGLVDGAADIAIANPPWLTPGRARVSPDPARALAHVARADTERHGGLEGWARALAAVLKGDGRMAMIHRADALPELLAACGARFGALEIFPVYPRASDPAIRIVVRGRKGSRAPMRLMPGLVLHEGDGSFTPRAEAIHRGEAFLAAD